MQVYTVGHSNHPIESFLQLLGKYNVNCICDVRSMPYSKYCEQYNREKIKELLSEHKIEYLFFGEEFGARRQEADLLTDGMTDFEKVAKNKEFLKGIERIKLGIKKNYKIALMCTEKVPAECHRSILVARRLSEIGIEVQHILADGTTIKQEKLEEELLVKYFPNRNQLSLNTLSIPEGYSEEVYKLKEAYKKANVEIGYRKKEDRQ